jgi:hypothetical protein
MAPISRDAVKEDIMPKVRKFCLSSLATATILAVSAAGTDCIGATGAGPASSNWEIMVWTDPLTVSVDTASIAPHAARITARVMWDYAEAQVSGGHGAAPYRSMIGTVVFDCATGRFGAAGSTTYSGDGGDGELVAQYAINPDNAELSSTEPGTIGNDLVAYVCAHAPPSKR